MGPLLPTTMYINSTIGPNMAAPTAAAKAAKTREDVGSCEVTWSIEEERVRIQHKNAQPWYA
jgi:hypothetical protein